MPLLMCPNDNSAMTIVERAGVQFDMCPTCRGVWLDRGEMEKLMEAGRSEAGPPPPPQPEAGGVGYRPRAYPSAPAPQHYGERGERGEWGEGGERGERGHYGGRHKGRSIFDIFD